MAGLPVANVGYSQQEYWESRYQNEPLETTYDWFKSYEDVAVLLRTYIPSTSARILMLGCGNSTLGTEMYDAGYEHIVNVDYSATCIARMKAANTDRERMQWLEGDITNLDMLTSGTFDVAIDKGTMDALMSVGDVGGTAHDVWNPPPAVVDACNAEVAEVVRLLKPGGTFLYFTFGQPHFRKRYLSPAGWSVKTVELGEMFHYYLYVMTREPSSV